MQFKSIGKDVTIYPKTKIICPENISIGNSVIIDDFVFINGRDGVTIGDFIHLAHFMSIAAGARCVIGDFGTISGGVRFYTANDDYTGMWLSNPTVPEKYKGVTRGDIILKKHVSIGANTVILPGIHVGEGVSIGANSLVNKDCVPWTIYVGTPAKPIRDKRRDRILEFEKQLREEVYDHNGNYIPKELR